MKIDKNRLDDLLLSESILLEMASYKWRSRWITDHKTGKEKRIAELVKITPQTPAEGWQKRTQAFYMTLLKTEMESSSQYSSIVAGRKKANTSSSEARKKKTTNWKQKFLKFIEGYQTKKVPKSRAISTFRKKHPRAPKASTLYSYFD
jgi:hypothetical protein